MTIQNLWVIVDDEDHVIWLKKLVDGQLIEFPMIFRTKGQAYRIKHLSFEGLPYRVIPIVDTLLARIVNNTIFGDVALFPKKTKSRNRLR